MSRNFRALVAVLSIVALPSLTLAAVINFDDLSDNAILGAQYGPAVLFSPGISGASGVLNPAASPEGFASSTSMEIASLAGGDIGGGVAAPISGNLLHSFNGWLSEDGDPAFTIDFATPIIGIAMDFGGVFELASTAVYAIDGSNNAIASASPAVTGTSGVILVPPSPVSRVVVTLGSYNDWVGVDNIEYEPVPEPASLALLALGSLLGLRRR